MIVKVQMSLASSDGELRALIYDKARKFLYEGGINDDVIVLMHGRPKAYFDATFGPQGVEIGDEVDAQDW